MTLADIPQAIRSEVWQRDAGRCRYCGLSQIGQGSVFHIDHIQPKSRGGPTRLENLALQCPNCSLHKSNKLDGRDLLTGHVVKLFNPLEQNWAEHFVLAKDGRLRGLTQQGRATVEALRMNDPYSRDASTHCRSNCTFCGPPSSKRINVCCYLYPRCIFSSTSRPVSEPFRMQLVSRLDHFAIAANDSQPCHGE